MMTNKRQGFLKTYWEFYVDLEEQVLETKRYAAFHLVNKNTFSLEYHKLILAVCSEIDTVAKFMAEEFQTDFKYQKNINIQKWGYVLQNMLPGLMEQEIILPSEVRITPWGNWRYEHTKKGYKLADAMHTPTWWIAYNRIKHARAFTFEEDKDNFTKANQEILLQAMAALYVLEVLYLHHIAPGQEIPHSKLFELNR